jgi:hypothetical protein
MVGARSTLSVPYIITSIYAATQSDQEFIHIDSEQEEEI